MYKARATTRSEGILVDVVDHHDGVHTPGRSFHDSSNAEREIGNASALVLRRNRILTTPRFRKTAASI